MVGYANFFSRVLLSIDQLCLFFKRWHHIFIAHKVILFEHEHLVVGLLEESSSRDAGRN
jgi:hypothetical protein